jgi:hypothetical protein
VHSFIIVFATFGQLRKQYLAIHTSSAKLNVVEEERQNCANRRSTSSDKSSAAPVRAVFSKKWALINWGSLDGLGLVRARGPENSSQANGAGNPGILAHRIRRKAVIETVKSFKYAQPFEPFDIELSSGRVLRVETPDHIAFAQAPGRLAVLNDDGTSLIVSILHVVNIGHLPPRNEVTSGACAFQNSFPQRLPREK